MTAADRHAKPTVKSSRSDAVHSESKAAALHAIAEEHLIRFGGEYVPLLKR